MINFVPKPICLIFTLYLAFFFISCAPRQVSIEDARKIQTHVLSVGLDAAMDAVVITLQDRLYLIDDIDPKLNIIMASRSTEKKLADTVVEVDDNEVPLWLKITGITIIIAIIGYLLFSVLDNDSDEEECEQTSHEHCNHSDHHHHKHYIHDNFNTDVTYQYKLNVTLSERDDERTQIHIIAQGEYLEDGNVVKAGAIQDPVFYNRIFEHIDNVIFD